MAAKSVRSLTEARSIVERASGLPTEPWGAEDAQDFRVFYTDEGNTGAATLVSKHTGEMRVVAVPSMFDKLGAMRRLGHWPG